jgi:hypothetical protein
VIRYCSAMLLLVSFVLLVVAQRQCAGATCAPRHELPRLTQDAGGGSVSLGSGTRGAQRARRARRIPGHVIPEAPYDAPGYGYERVARDPTELAALRSIASDTTDELARIVDELTPDTAEQAVEESRAVIEAQLAAERELLGDERAAELERIRDGAP